jgi:hypothetical protein
MSLGSKFFQGAVRDAVEEWKFPEDPNAGDAVDSSRHVTVPVFQVELPVNKSTVSQIKLRTADGTPRHMPKPVPPMA